MLPYYAECRYAEFGILFVVMLNVKMLSVNMLSVIVPLTDVIFAVS